jgi:hypothetical protein
MIVMRCVAIKSDEQLCEWFNLNLENGVVQIDAQINNFDGLLQFSPIKHRLHPIVRERVREKVLQTPSQPTQEGTTTTKEDKKKTKPCDEEAIGVDEEHMYSDSDSLLALSDNSYDTDLLASSDSDIDSSDPEYDPDD